MTRFYEFVYSPYHNKHLEVRALVGYLTKIYPQFTEKKCDRVKIFKQLFPKKQHNQGELALLFTYAFRLAKDFLSIEHYQKQETHRDMAVLTTLKEKELTQFYEKKLIKTQKQFLGSKYRNSIYFRDQFELIKATFTGYQPRSWKELSVDLSEKQYYLDYFYLAERLKFACALLVRSKVLGIEFDNQFMENILATLELDWLRYQKIPPISVYYHLYRMIHEEDAQRYYEALPIIEQNSQFFPKGELHHIYTYVQNFCIKQINEGIGGFMEELLKIYKIQLDRRLLHNEKSQLSEWHYKNIVTLGLRLNETEWVSTFIENYRTEIPLENRDNAYSFNKAVYAYETGDYEKVLALLLKVEYTDVQYDLGARWLLLRTYYEMEASTAFLALCDSFRLYLQRNKLISDFKKKGYEQAIRYLKRAFHIKLDAPYQNAEKTKKEIEKLKKEISETETIFNRAYLEKKLIELSAKKARQLKT